jgi:mannosyltransferase
MSSSASASTAVQRLGTSRADLWVLGAVVLAGALLRIVTLGDQSLWFDEGLTRNLVVKPLGDLVEAVVDTENTPPLSYVLTYMSTQLVGTDEVGLRLVSALAGTATIPVAYLAGRELAGERAGLVAAGLVAANPLLFWFSQEARSYALLVLLSAIALVCFLRVLSGGRSRWALAGWVLSSTAALVTHYFAVFPMAAEAAWMLAVFRASDAWRGVVAAVAAAGVAAVAVAPMAISQEASGRAESLADEDLGQRIAQVPKQLLVGYDGPQQNLLIALSVALLAVAAVGLWRIRAKPQVLATAAVAIAAIIVPVVAAVLGVDFLNTRNVLPGLVPLLALAAAGFSTVAQPWGLLSAGALAAVGVVTVVGVSATETYQREDWRAVNTAIGESQEARLLVASPERADVPLRAYRDGIALARDRPLEVRELILASVAVKSGAGSDAAPPRPEPPPEIPSFTLAARELADTFTLYRYRSSAPVAVRPEQLAGITLGVPGSVLVVPAAR